MSQGQTTAQYSSVFSGLYEIYVPGLDAITKKGLPVWEALL